MVFLLELIDGSQIYESTAQICVPALTPNPNGFNVFGGQRELECLDGLRPIALGKQTNFKIERSPKKFFLDGNAGGIVQGRGRLL
jgi:hypothetical protein